MDLRPYISSTTTLSYIFLAIFIFCLMLSVRAFVLCKDIDFCILAGEKECVKHKTWAIHVLAVAMVMTIPLTISVRFGYKNSVTAIENEIQKETGYTLSYESVSSIVSDISDHNSDAGTVKATDKNGNTAIITYIRDDHHLDLYVAKDMESLFPKSDTKQ